MDWSERTAALATILIYMGNNIMPNISLYTPEVLGQASEAFVGYQNLLRFLFKVGAGLLLGCWVR